MIKSVRPFNYLSLIEEETRRACTGKSNRFIGIRSMNLNTVRFDETRGGIVFFFFFFLTLSKKFFIGISPPSVTLSLSPRSSFLPPLPLPSSCFFFLFLRHFDTNAFPIPTFPFYRQDFYGRHVHHHVPFRST